MATTPTVDTDAYQDLEQLRSRVDYDGTSLFQDNHQLRFDELLVRLERESRGIFETLWGDQTPLEETDRVDEKRTTDDAAIMLVYPINDVTKVEYKRSQAADYETLDSEWYDFTKHRLVLERRPTVNSMRQQRRANPAAATAMRATWRDIAVKIRVTYDRGFGEEPPADIQSIQVAIVNEMLRRLRQEQTVAAASPDDFAGVAEGFDDVVGENIRERISDVTSPSGATLSI